MDRAFLDRMKNLFDTARRLPAAERSVYLDRECGETPEGRLLRGEVESLLRSLNEAGDFLGDPTIASQPSPVNAKATTAGSRRSKLPDYRPEAPTERRNDSTVSAPLFEGPGTRIGPYKLLQQIGEGGFGVVFMAEQEKPVRRRVALKIIKLGMDTRQVVARFEAERQALAVMDHPNIAKVHDGGATETGRPYFVMELVKGHPITTYCDEHKLPIPQRLNLFVQVCQAVQHAHTKGVIHRDIKPSNVLVSEVDGRPLVKVIDFGIAKATDHRLTEKTIFTQFEQMIGTPQYMSPEQAAGSNDIDTRTDVYSLGVLLYELLTGTTPFEESKLRSAAYDEIRRIIREDEPPKPSTRLSALTEPRTRVRNQSEPRGSASNSPTSLASVAAVRQIEPGKLTKLVRGDLDWIVMKALEKDRGRRYETANGLAAELLRYLAGEPVIAAPPSRAYRFRRLVRRNRVIVAASTSIVLALVLGLAGTIWQARKAHVHALRADERAIAEKERADQLKQVSDFQASMLGQVDPTAAGVLLSRDVLAQVEAAAAKAGIQESEQATIIADFRSRWIPVNPTDTARRLVDATILTPAIAAIDTKFKTQPIVDAHLRQALADCYYKLGLYDAALPLQETALKTRQRYLNEEHTDSLNSACNLAMVLFKQGKLKQAETCLRDGLERSRHTLGEENPLTLTFLNNLGLLLREQGRIAEAEPCWAEALAKRRRVLGDDHPETLTSINNMGSLLQEKGQLEKSEAYYREALEKSRRVLGDDHVDTIITISNMGSLSRARGKLRDAEAYYREALEKRRRVLGEDHPDTPRAIFNLAMILGRRGKADQAEPLMREALQKRRLILGDDHAETIASISALGVVLQDRGKLSEAESQYREALNTARRVLGDDHIETIRIVGNLGRLLQSRRRFDQAEPLYREALESRRRILGNEHPETLESVTNMGILLRIQGKLADAEPYYRESAEVRRRVLGMDHPDTLASIHNLGILFRSQGKMKDAEEHYREALENRRRVLGDDHPSTFISVIDLGELLRSSKRYDETVALLEPFRGNDSKTLEGENAARYASMLVNLGIARTHLDFDSSRFANSKTDLLQARAILAKIRGETHIATRNCTQALIDLYDAWNAAQPGNGYDAKAAKWRLKLAQSTSTSAPVSQSATSQPSESMISATAPTSTTSEPGD